MSRLAFAWASHFDPIAQHVLNVNSGEFSFGGSTAQAPFERAHKRWVLHMHGGSRS